MKCALIGSKYFGASIFEALRQLPGVEFVSVVAPAADDRLALAAQAAGIAPHILVNPRFVPGAAVAEGIDLIVAAHTHARVSDAALARARLGGVGYHPSLLPRHRGIAAVEWTILAGDPIAGGSVYHLADGWDAGAVAAQDWCFVLRGDTARTLWERALAPMGLALLSKVVGQARDEGRLPSYEQDARFATKAPLLRKAVVLKEGAAAQPVSLVATVMGPDRPGIVNLLADKAQRHGANWTASRMANLAGEFAGMVHFEVAAESADALSAALLELQSTGLNVAVARTVPSAAPAAPRAVELELVGPDRLGIVSQLTGLLAARGISIESIQTELANAQPSGSPSFRVSARLTVPANVAIEGLRHELDELAQDMMLDIALGDAGAWPPEGGAPG